MKKLLTKENEKWAKEHGGTEFASDCELFNEESLRFHLRIGYAQNRYKKAKGHAYMLPWLFLGGYLATTSG